MGRVIVFVLIAALLVGVIARGALKARRVRREREAETPELHKHPERLNQMLDPTDDA